MPLSLSVVVCTYSMNRYVLLAETLESLFSQDTQVSEILVVVDSDNSLNRKLQSDFSGCPNLKVIFSPVKLSVNQARNLGVKSATMDIVAFTDDDAVTAPDWATELIKTYEKTGAYSVGGRIIPIWPEGKSEFLPPELYWLVGCTHRGFATEGISEVRDTYAPNMSFKREVFEKIGYINENFGFSGHGTGYMQGEEAEFGLRFMKAYNQRVNYNPKAIVYHHVPESKLKFVTLINRSFYQGLTKAHLKREIHYNSTLDVEKTFARDIVIKFIPEHIGNIFRTPAVSFKQLFILLSCLSAVVAGFARGLISTK